MSSQKFIIKVLAVFLSAAMVLAMGGSVYPGTQTLSDEKKADLDSQKTNKDMTDTKKYIGTYRTEAGHAIEGSQEFAITIQKIDHNKIWGAFSWGGASGGCGYGEWNGAPIINNKVQGIFYYAQTIPASYNSGKLDSEFFKEPFYLYLDNDSLYFDLTFITNGKKIKLVSESEYPDDGYREQEYKNWLVEGNNL